MSHTYKDKEDCNTNFNLMKEFHPISKENDRTHHIFLYKKLRASIDRTQCFENVTQVLVGLSGGVDSAILLHLLCEYQKKENGPKIFALHIHHGQRGEESDRDEIVARELAMRAGCSFETIKLKEAKIGMSEDELRNLRHTALENFAKENNCERIALAHHQDDQTETFLFRLIRGADLRGLSSMKIFRDPYVRPLLECTRLEIEKEAEICGIPFIHDSSNFSNGPARNFVRNVLLPAIKAKLDPQVGSHLADISASLAEIDTFLSNQAIEMIKEVQVEPHVYNVSKLKDVPVALRKKMIQFMYTYIIKDNSALSRDHVEMINRWMESTQSPKYLLLPFGIRVDKKQNVLTFSIVDG
jgi:tRNA(Ile)-lysidine synthase